MNAFKAIFTLCAILGASSALQYKSNGQRGWESESNPAGHEGTVQQGVQQSWATVNTADEASLSEPYGMFSIAPAETHQTSAMPAPEVDDAQEASVLETEAPEYAAPAAQHQSSNFAQTATTSSTIQHQICSCVNLPAAPQIPVNNMSSFASPSVAAPAAEVAAAPVAQQNAYAAAPADQTSSTVQNTYAASQQQARPQQTQTSFNTAKAY